MAIIRLAFMLLCITNISFAESNTPRTLSPENKKLLNNEDGIAGLLERLTKLEATCTETRSDAVGTNFKCAMDTFKNGFTDFMASSGVSLLKRKKCEWNPLVLQYRIENDLIWKKPELMYPEKYEGASKIVHENDNTAMCQWIEFVSLDLKRNHFYYPKLQMYASAYKISNRKAYYPLSAAVSAFKATGLALQNNLNDYYEKLDQKTRDTRYPKGKSDLYSYFAGVMVRMYRFGCYYAYDLENSIKLHLRRTYTNGTNFFLSTAIIESMPTWYVDQEHLDMFNIVLRTQGYTKDKDFFFVSKNITNGKEQQVVIPGFKNCGSEPV